MEGFIEIPEADGHYLIDSNGSVYSRKTKRFMKPGTGSSGYLQVVLRIGGKSVNVMVHRLVAKVFIPNPKNVRVVNHLNGRKHDNSVANLEWCTYSENSIHANRTGLNQNPPAWAKGKFGAEHNRSITIYSYNDKGIFLAAYEGINDAGRRLNIMGSTIGHALKSGSFSRLAQCFFFYEEQTMAQVLQIKSQLQASHIKRGESVRRTFWAYTPEGKYLAEFAGMEAAAKAYGITAHNVADSIRFNRTNKKSGVRFFNKKPPE